MNDSMKSERQAGASQLTELEVIRTKISDEMIHQGLMALARYELATQDSATDRDLLCEIYAAMRLLESRSQA